MRLILFAMLLSPGAGAYLNSQGQIVPDQIQIACTGQRGVLNFALNRTTHIAVFTNVEAMGRAQIPHRQPIAAVIDANTVAVTYDWHFVAEYKFKFERPVHHLRSGERVNMWLEGDDDGGFWFNDVPFSCVIR